MVAPTNDGKKNPDTTTAPESAQTGASTLERDRSTGVAPVETIPCD
jgi:hypothetical protein